MAICFESDFDPNADPDGDGWTNAQEAAAGTNPFDANEPAGYLRPQIVHIPESWTDLNQDGIDEHTPEAVTITWPTIPGKQYALLYSPNLTDWLPVPDETFIGTGTVVTFGVLMPVADKLFWRVQIEDVDSDGDGLTDAEECELGTDPHNAQTLDGIPDLWLARYFTNTLLAGDLNTIDPNAYANTDGYTIVQEAYLNLDPNTPHTPPTGPIGQQCIVNGDFSQPVIGSSLSNTSDPAWNYWGLGVVPGWSAVVGTNIEFQNTTPKETGNPYVELKAEPAGHYGIKQEVGTSKGATYLLMLDCRDRPDVGPECSNFNVLIDGEIKCKINFSAPTATTPPDKFVAPGAWTTVAVPFTATRPVTPISLVPVNTLDDTTGCLVDNVNLLPVEIAGDNDDDGDIDQADRQAREKHPIVLQRKLNKTDTARTIVVRKISLPGIPIKLVKTGVEKIIIKSKQTGAVLMPEAQSESIDIGPFVSQSDYEIALEGVENGQGAIALKIGDAGVTADPMPIRVLNADVIFRNGSNNLASLIANNVTHGGFDSGDDNIHDIGGSGIETITLSQFYSVAVTPTKRRVIFRQTNYMAGRIWEKVFDNMLGQKFDNPTGAKPWNLFTTSDNYVTSNCLEWLHHQWQRSVREVYGELQTAQQKTAFESAYFDGTDVKSLVIPDLIKTIAGNVGVPEAYVAALVAAADLLGKSEINKDVFHNQFEGDFVYFYPGYYGTPIDQVPWWVSGVLDLLDEGQLRTITPNSYLDSTFFEEVAY